MATVIKQGDAVQMPIKISMQDAATGETIQPMIGDVEKVEVCIGDGIRKLYPDEITYDESSGCFCVPLTQEDTRRLPKYKRVYMDTRITFPDGAIPTTNIVDLSVTETLFGGDSA